ncbi:MAG: hypothetical protein HUK24_09295 [Sphaerochaetaceae bacterium]|nr:hypothetical protein [Sphaerochaetaceae bacterium]
MKKTLTILLLLITFLAYTFAESTTGNLNLSAYKEQAIVLPTDVILSVIASSNTSADISNQVVDISNEIDSNRTVNNAFSITVSSNLRADAVLTLEFTPFINQADATKKVGIIYSYSTEPYVTVTGSYDVQNYCKCRYTPEAYLTNNATSISVPSSSTTVTTTLTQRVAKIERRWNSWNSTWNKPEWVLESSYGDFGQYDGKHPVILLPGFEGTDAIYTTSNFTLTIPEADYSNMVLKSDYFASVKITYTIS